MKHLFREKSDYDITVIVFFFGLIFFSLSCSSSVFATKNILSNSVCQFGALSESDLSDFSQNDILFYEPCTSVSSSLTATGDYAAVMKAKNADKWFFNGEGNIRNGGWGTNEESIKSILEAYGDLAYQTGRAAGIPWIAILAQMPWEDPDSVCGHNNFWGNGCNSSHAYVGGADEVIGKAENLGEGFIKYAETVHNGLYEEALTKTDPLEYIRALEGTWIGTGASYNIEGHINAMTEYIKTPEGEAIVKTFGSYSGSSSSSSSSSSAGSSSNTGVKWDNGWIVEDSMEGAIKQDVNGKTDLSEAVNPVGSYTTSDGKPDKILLHNTQGLGEGYDVYPSGNKFPAHFTIDLKNKKVWQHFSIYQPSLAVATYDKSGPIQIEIVGFSKKATKKDDGTFEYENPAGYKSEWDLQNFSDEDWDYLAKLLLAISEETGIPLTSSVEWTPGMKNGLSKEEFLNYKGVLGHMHTPDNNSEDPGDVWQYVEAAINRQDNKCTTYDGEYPEYLQGDSKWGSMPYGSGTMADSGCGAASMAMLATVAAGKDIFPNDIADLLGNQYYDSTSVHVLDPKVGEHYGFEVKTDNSSSEEETKNKFRDYLKKGYMIHYTGHGCYPGFQSGDYCSPGHVIGIFSIDKDDNVMLADSAFGGNQKVSLDTVAKTKLWDAFTAIKGGNISKNNCDDYCNDSGNSANYGSLTEEQAQKIADYYNSNEVTASNFIGGIIPSDYGKVNCVSFSYWFVSAFTDASEKGVTSSIIGDGAYIASTGLPGVGWENGNDPTPYSIFGGAGSGAWTHTGVVVGTTDSGDILTIEAAYAIHDARVMTRSKSYFAEGVGILAYPGDHFTASKGYLGNKSLNEIIGN